MFKNLEVLKKNIYYSMTTTYIKVTSDITTDTTWFNEAIYVITGEVRVKSGVKLTIQDKTNVYFRNGLYFGTDLVQSTLIFESGSKLCADTVYCFAADRDGDAYVKATLCNNGGIIFLGTYADSTPYPHLPNIAAVKSDTVKSCFRACSIQTNLLGSGEYGLNGMTVAGVGSSEWKVKKVDNEQPAENGFAVYNSVFSINSLKVYDQLIYGLYLNYSTITVHNYLNLVDGDDGIYPMYFVTGTLYVSKCATIVVNGADGLSPNDAYVLIDDPSGKLPVYYTVPYIYDNKLYKPVKFYRLFV